MIHKENHGGTSQKVSLTCPPQSLQCAECADFLEVGIERKELWCKLDFHSCPKYSYLLTLSVSDNFIAYDPPQ